MRKENCINIVLLFAILGILVIIKGVNNGTQKTYQGYDAERAHHGMVREKRVDQPDSSMGGTRGIPAISKDKGVEGSGDNY